MFNGEGNLKNDLPHIPVEMHVHQRVPKYFMHTTHGFKREGKNEAVFSMTEKRRALDWFSAGNEGMTPINHPGIPFRFNSNTLNGEPFPTCRTSQKNGKPKLFTQETAVAPSTPRRQQAHQVLVELATLGFASKCKTKIPNNGQFHVSSL